MFDKIFHSENGRNDVEAQVTMRYEADARAAILSSGTVCICGVFPTIAFAPMNLRHSPPRWRANSREGGRRRQRSLSPRRSRSRSRPRSRSRSPRRTRSPPRREPLFYHRVSPPRSAPPPKVSKYDNQQLLYSRRKVFVAGLPSDGISEDDIFHALEGFGAINNIQLAGEQTSIDQMEFLL